MGALGVDGWKLIVQIVAFLIFIALLWRLALGPIVRVLDERQSKIADSMAAAQQMQENLKATAAQNEAELRQARQEAQAILTQARESATAVVTRAEAVAATKQQEYLEQAQATLRAETEQARLQLRQEIAGLAVGAATKIIRKELDPATQTRLIEETLAEAGTGASRSTNGSPS